MPAIARCVCLAAPVLAAEGAGAVPAAAAATTCGEGEGEAVTVGNVPSAVTKPFAPATERLA